MVTVGRSDYGIYRPVLRKISGHPDLRLALFVTGTHLSPEFGLTVSEIEKDGFPIAERIEMLLSADSPEAVGKAMGLGLIGFTQALSRSRPDILLVLGDRFEMFSAAAASVPLNLPLAHIHGGETTQGAIDESFRHAIAKMSHLHFAATEAYAKRLTQMGEAPWRVMVSGAPALDAMQHLPPADPVAFGTQYGVPVSPRPLLVTFHPETLAPHETRACVDSLLTALAAVRLPVIFTAPNADAGGRLIRERIEHFVASEKNGYLVENFGSHAYYDAMRLCAAMIGNSSSGIIEAASFELPVVNLGTRQDGRVRARNVIDVECDSGQIEHAIRRGLSPEFRAALRGMTNPYGDGQAADRIVQRLAEAELGDRILRKIFYDKAGS